MRPRQPSRPPLAQAATATGSGRWPEPEVTAEDEGAPTEEWADDVRESFEQAITLVNQKLPATPARRQPAEHDDWWDDEITKVDSRTR
jgi:hypothetical protein